MPILGPLISAGAELAGGLLGNSAQSRANRANVRLARENREWEEKMSNTSYQRGVRDMLRAGINPMLAVSQGGASTPNATAPEVQPVNSAAKAIQGAPAAAASALAIQAQTIANERAKEDLRIQRFRNDQEVAYNHPDDAFSDREMSHQKLIDEARRTRSLADIEATNVEIKNIERRIAQETESTRITSAQSQLDLLNKQITLAELQSMSTRLDLPEKEAMAKWFNAVGAGSPLLKATMSIGQWLKMIFGKN